MQKDDDFYAIRLRLHGGRITADQPLKVAEVARKYGRGTIRSPPGRDRDSLDQVQKDRSRPK